MELGKWSSSSSSSSNPNGSGTVVSISSSFVQHQWHRIKLEVASRMEEGKRALGNALTNIQQLKLNHPLPPPSRSPHTLPFASLNSTSVFDLAMSSDFVAKALAGTSVYTVSNSNNEFVLISDPNNIKSLGLLCFRHEDAQALLTQVQLKHPVLSRGARVVPITLDQVYMLKVEGIAFRFLPDPAQIRNALELKGRDLKIGFDGVPVFQSDLLVVKKKNKRYCPIYFQKEDIERELSKVSRSSRGQGISQHIMVGNLEDVLKKMEVSDKNTGWEDLIFIPPGKTYSQHIQEVAMG